MLDFARPDRVILADDDDELRTLMAEALRGAAFAVTETCDADGLLRAVQAARSERDVCALIVEASLPRAGVPVLQAARALMPRVPLVVLTSFPSPEVRARIEAIGAYLIEKPLDLGALVERLSEVCERALSTGGVSPHPAP